MNSEFRQLEDLYFQRKHSEAYLLAIQLASSGDLRSVRFLGWLHLHGHGCQQDEKKAMSFFLEAANQGDAEALFGIANIYYSNKEYKDAARYLEEAMKKGYVPAIRWSGVMYQLGLGVNKDLDRAYHLYNQAAQAGNLSAYCQKSLMLLHGFRGIYGRLLAIPMMVKFFICATVEAYRNKDSQRLM